MPELPEVECISRGLNDSIAGFSVKRFSVMDPKLRTASTPQGRIIDKITRRGKFLVFHFSQGGAALLHLRMSGSCVVVDPATLKADGVPPYSRMRMDLANADDDGSVVRHFFFKDPRRFGTFEWDATGEVLNHLNDRLGAEPLDSSFNHRKLKQILEGSGSAVKSVILDQRKIAGIGNIYADESLWIAQINPMKRSREVDAEHAKLLCQAIKERLSTAIRFGGSTLRDYRSAEGTVGGMQEHFHVYGKAGDSCQRCGGTLVSGRVGGRGTTWCATCQPA